MSWSAQLQMRDATKQILAGGTAGFVEISMMHPLDVIKTRFQIQRGLADSNRYSSILDCVRKMSRNEGLLSFYKGIFPPLSADPTKRAIKFVSFEQFRDGLQWLGCENQQCLVVGGLASGIAEASFICPFERVKVHLQAKRSRMSELPSTWSCVKHIVKNDGIGSRGLFKGLTATQCRDGTWNCLYFFTYHNLKCTSGKTGFMSSTINQFLVGLLAGSIATVSNTPFDVAKSRIQGPQPPHNPHKYKTTLRTISTVFREEGFLALYKGFVPKILRLGPGGAVMFVVYENVSSWISSIHVNGHL